MNDTTLDWEKYEAQSLLIQKLISDNVSTPDSPYSISRITTPKNLVGLSADSFTLETPASALSSQRTNGLLETLSCKQREVPARSPLKNLTNSGNSDLTPEKTNSGPISLPTSAEFKEFLSKITEISPTVHRAVSGSSLNSSEADVSRLLEKNHARKGTYDLSDVSVKPELNTATENSRLRLGTYDTSPSSSLLASRLKESVSEGDTGDVFVPNQPDVVPVNRLIPPVVIGFSFEDCDTDLTSSDESSCEEPLEKIIPHSELLVVIDEDLKLSSKGKKAGKRKEPRKKMAAQQEDSLSKVPEGLTSEVVNTLILVDQTPDVMKVSGDLFLKSQSMSDSGDNKPVIPKTEAKREEVCDTVIVHKADSQDFKAVSSTQDVANVSVSSAQSSVKKRISGSSQSLRLVSRQGGIPSTAGLASDKNSATGETRINLQSKRSSLATPAQAKAAENVAERRRSNPTVKTLFLKPGPVQPKLVKRSSLEALAVKDEPSAPAAEPQKVTDSVLSKTVTKTQPTMSKLLQRNIKPHPPTAIKEAQSPNKPSAQAPEVRQKTEKKAVRCSLLPPRSSLGSSIRQPSKPLLAVMQDTSKDMPHLPAATQEVTTKSVPIKSSLTTMKTLKLIKPGFTRTTQQGTISSIGQDSVLQKKEVSQVEGAGHRPSEAGDGSRKSGLQIPSRKGPAPVKAIFRPEGPKGSGAELHLDVSKIVTKERPDMSRTVTKESKPDNSRTVTKEKSDDAANHVAPTEVCQFTPMKSEKTFNPRRLSDVFLTSATPGGNKLERNGKITKIPTPHSSMLSSHSSLGSNSSFLKPSDFESPFTCRKSSTEDSLSAFKPKRAMVRYTPEVEPRRQSMWSPVKKKPLPDDDMVHLCTKKLLQPGQKSSQ